ncbi:MAG: hypothetical protein EOM02_14395 [Synergistales bacterium]|nr:hypothetical protein [Synergistales bacterium]
MPSNEGTSVLRFGYVSDFDPAKKLVRVRFPDKNNLVSGWLQLLCSNTKENKDEINLDIGEHVVCLMAGNGIEVGVVMGALWDEKNLPIIADGDIRVSTYKDGTTVWVDRKNHIVEVKDHYGSYIHFEGKNIEARDAHGSYVYLHDTDIRVEDSHGSYVNLNGGNIEIRDSHGSYVDLKEGNIRVEDSHGSYVDLSDGEIKMGKSNGSIISFDGDDISIEAARYVYLNEKKKR